jgi:acetoin utilization deacetylase AcuC-like enzyme
MTTLYVCHPATLDHLTPLGHPERADRIRVIERVLEQERFTALAREQAPMGELEAVALAHTEPYIATIRDAAPREGLVRIDADTVMSPAPCAPPTR